MANRNRTAGIKTELQIAEELRKLGFDKIVTTRSESKRMDDLGVDLIQLPGFHLELPFYPQIKKTINTPSVDLLELNLEKPMVVFYQKQEKQGKRFYTVGDYIMMKKDFFYKLLNHAIPELQRHQDSTR